MARRKEQQISPVQFFSALKWIDKRPLLDVIEGYRRRIFTEALYKFDGDGRPKHNLVLTGRAKKNWKSADLILAGLYRLMAWRTHGGNTCLVVATDEGQAADDLDLAKKLIKVNPVLRDALRVKTKEIERRDDEGFLQILPGQDTAGAHGKSFLFLGIDEIHTQRDWDLLEALQLDPTRPDAMQWITSYASIYHKPGVPLFDLCAAGWRGDDARMLFSWYAADRTTDAALGNAAPEDRANPSRGSWQDARYLEQQQRRLPAHKYRRLHLNLPGLPEGSAFTAEKVMESIERGVKVRLPVEGVEYAAFVDMSGGSNDDATLSIAHKDGEGRAILDVVMDQGQRPPFDPRKAVERFAAVLKEYRCFSVVGDKYAGETFIKDFETHGIGYQVSELTKSQLYEAMEPPLNAGQIVFLDEPTMESQFLGLMWRGGKIDHPGEEHDDFANSAAGAIHAAAAGAGSFEIEGYGSYVRPEWGTGAPSNEGETLANQIDGMVSGDRSFGGRFDW